MTPQNLIFIGDVHGQYGKLCALLEHLDFLPAELDSAAARSQLVFLGDLIDNRPTQVSDHHETLALVKAWCDQGLAYCLLGNHEFNAVGWALKHPKTGAPLRRHSDNNRKQHQQFLDEVGEGSLQYQAWIDWFMRLPLFYDFGHVRAIHACWQDNAIHKIQPYLNEDNSLKIEHWPDAFDERHELYQLCETLLKGPELALPEGYHFVDKTGTERHHVRVKWWQEQSKTYRDIAQVQPDMVTCIPSVPLRAVQPHPAIEIPVVIGHYTLAGLPAPLSDKVVCVDYNAASESGELVAYCWWQDEDEPHQLHENHFEYLGNAEFGRAGLDIMMQLFNQLADRYPPVSLSSIQTEVMRECLLKHWDPACIGGLEACQNEYDDYLTTVATLAQQGSWGDLSAYLMGITKIHFNQDLDPVSADRLAKRLRGLMSDYQAAAQEIMHG